jgi:hypothetical protein
MNKIFVSTPFRSYGNREYFADSLFGVNETVKKKYVDAMLLEIREAAVGMEEMEIDEIEFGNGPISSITVPDLMRIMREIRKNYRISENVLIHGMEIPGGVTVDFLGFFRSMHFSYLELEMLTVDYDALRRLSLPPVDGYMHVTRHVITCSGNPTFGIILDGAVEPNAEAFRKSVIEACCFQPDFIRTRSSIGADFKKEIDEISTKHGYQCRTAGFYQKENFGRVGEPHVNQLGFGVNAINEFDGVRYKTTSNLMYYIAHSQNFELVAKPLAEA